jgi:hypothetical protein
LYRISLAGYLNLVLLIFDTAFSVTTEQSWKYPIFSSISTVLLYHPEPVFVFKIPKLSNRG